MFQVPFVPVNTASWGPPTQQGGESSGELPISKFQDLPYAPFGRGDRIGKVADFTAVSAAAPVGRMGDGRRDRFNRFGRTSEENEGFTYKTDPKDEGFELVDTQKSGGGAVGAKRFMAPAAKRRQQRTSLRQLNARRAAANQGAAGGGTDRYNQVSNVISGSFYALSNSNLIYFLLNLFLISAPTNSSPRQLRRKKFIWRWSRRWSRRSLARSRRPCCFRSYPNRLEGRRRIRVG